MGDLASRFDPELAQICDDNRRRVEEAIMKHMYNRTTQRFHHRWQAKDGTMKDYDVKTIQTLFPLLLTTLPAEAVQKIVDLLGDPNEFGTQYMIPTVS